MVTYSFEVRYWSTGVTTKDLSTIVTKRSGLLHVHNGNKIPKSGACRVKVSSQDKTIGAIFVVVHSRFLDSRPVNS